MKDKDRTAQSTGSGGFAQEMQQAFVDWVRKLPFITKKIPELPDREHPGEVSAEKASASRPTDGEGGT